MIGRLLRKTIHLIFIPLIESVLFLRRKIKEGRYPDEGKGKIIITKLDAIGDYTLLRSFFRILKEDPRYGNYHITLIGNKLWEDISKTFDSDFIDEAIYIFPEKLRSSLVYRTKFLWSLQNKSYEIYLAPTKSRKFLIDESIAFNLRAKRKITQESDNLNMKGILKWLGKSFYHDVYKLGEEGTQFEFIRNRVFFERFTGCEMAALKPQFFSNEGFLKLERKYQPRYVVFAPGASQESRRWPVLNFIRVGRFILDYTSFNILILGSKHDLEIGREIQNRLNTHERVFNSIGKFPLRDLVSLITYSEFVVANETGTVHLAAFLDKVVFCPSNGQHIGRFHPYPPSLAKPCHYFYPIPLFEDLKKAQTEEDYKTLYKKFKKGSPFVAGDISPERMISSIQSLFLKKN